MSVPINELQMLAMQLEKDGWTPWSMPDEVDDDSDKSWSVPSRRRLFLTHVSVKYASSADVGNRQLEILIKDENAKVIARNVAGAVQAASATVYYEFDLSFARETSVVASVLQCSLGGVLMKPGYTIQVIDSAAIAAAADDVHFFLAGLSYLVPKESLFA